MHHCNPTLPFWGRAETQVSGFHSISFALGSCSKERKWDRLARIDVARAWAAASTNMWKKSRWSMVRGPMTATMATLHDFSIIPASPWKWYQLKTRTLAGFVLVATQALSSVKCNRDSPTRSGNRRLCTVAGKKKRTGTKKKRKRDKISKHAGDKKRERDKKNRHSGQNKKRQTGQNKKNTWDKRNDIGTN